jgi:hypothetical protein
MIKFESFQIIKVAIATLMIFSVLFIMCSSESTRRENKIKRIDLIYNIPIVKLSGELQNVTDSLSIFYHNSFILYRFPYTYSVENANRIESQERRFKYFIYRNHNPYGYYFDSLNASRYSKMNVDSLLSAKAFASNNFYDMNNDSLVEAIKSRGNFSLIEKYISKTKPDQSYADTTIFYFTDKFKDLKLSFSMELEKIKNLKICKVRIIYKAHFDRVYNIELPNREFVFQLREEPNVNSDEILSFFNSFEKKY